MSFITNTFFLQNESFITKWVLLAKLVGLIFVYKMVNSYEITKHTTNQLIKISDYDQYKTENTSVGRLFYWATPINLQYKYYVYLLL